MIIFYANEHLLSTIKLNSISMSLRYEIRDSKNIMSHYNITNLMKIVIIKNQENEIYRNKIYRLQYINTMLQVKVFQSKIIPLKEAKISSRNVIIDDEILIFK